MSQNRQKSGTQAGKQRNAKLTRQGAGEKAEDQAGDSSFFYANIINLAGRTKDSMVLLSVY